MKKIRIEAREQTPYVNLDKENSVLEIKGYSFPDEAYNFYIEIVDWFKEYSQDPNSETKMVFDFNYLNSTSVKFINEILKRLDTVHEAGKKVSVEWLYNADDEDIQQLGITLKDFHTAPISVVVKKADVNTDSKKFFD